MPPSGPSKPSVARWIWWTGALSFGLVAVTLTALAYRDWVPNAVRENDKLVHFTLAGSLVFFLDGVLRRRAVPIARLEIPFAFVLVIGPAGIEELLQRFSTYRTSDLADFLADLAGGLAFLWLSRRLA